MVFAACGAEFIDGERGADQALTQMAENGKEPNQTAGEKAYYSVSNTADLVTVLGKIAGQIVSCSYALQTAPANPDLVVIQSDGVTVQHDTGHSSGWDHGAGDLSITFYGAPCDALRSGSVTSIQAIYECPPIM